jgi:hypothetical protein
MHCAMSPCVSALSDLWRGTPSAVRARIPLDFFDAPTMWTLWLSSVSPCYCCYFRLFLLFYYTHNSLLMNVVSVPAPKFTTPKNDWSPWNRYYICEGNFYLVLVTSLIQFSTYIERDFLFYLRVICKQSSSFLVTRLLAVYILVETFLIILLLARQSGNSVDALLFHRFTFADNE